MNKPIKAKFSHIVERKDKKCKFHVVFIAEDGKYLITVCKWITNSKDVNSYISYENGYVVGCNDKGKYKISQAERLKAVDEVFTKLSNKK